ncbi:hypothetical protein CKM354_000920900 [Cercospora kikuchii]|uniref:Thioredoxin domain-containing protein n=1 Tax=Cercospora kikuchii TaxID=84275 RepID=A0A9P3CSX2_9PEZI|nr:uncharacterized protein CKM354_000920900 [Cercospora kikuchii]GIZ46070.1 hypothetical protein CKM354_000920900 [Cercospora kikuchii]
MPILTAESFTLPASASSLTIPAFPPAFFIAYLASKDPNTQKPWCPDVVASLPTLEATFTGSKKPTVAFVEVGQRPEWRVQSNVFRTVWNVHNVPTLVRYENVGGEVKETGRLVEGEILDDTKLQKLLEGAGAAA